MVILKKTEKVIVILKQILACQITMLISATNLITQTFNAYLQTQAYISTVSLCTTVLMHRIIKKQYNSATVQLGRLGNELETSGYLNSNL